MPPTLTYSTKNLMKVEETVVGREIGYPHVMKGVNGNRGAKVFMVRNEGVLTEMAGVLEHDCPYLFSTYIKESHGRDLRVIVVDGKVEFVIMRQSTGGMKANLAQGGSALIVTGKYPQAEELAIKITKILNMDISGCDLLFDETSPCGFVICEVNNNPGLASDIHDGNQIEDRIAEMCLRKAGITASDENDDGQLEIVSAFDFEEQTSADNEEYLRLRQSLNRTSTSDCESSATDRQINKHPSYGFNRID